MADYHWSNALETGDALVDQQHRDIYTLVAHVARAEDRPAEVMLALDRLMEHVDCHFATEEALMRSLGYEAERVGAHMAEHRSLTQSARETVLEFRSGALRSTAALTNFLREWIAEHVREHDRHFIQFVRAQLAQAELPEPWASNPPAPPAASA